MNMASCYAVNGDNEVLVHRELLLAAPVMLHRPVPPMIQIHLVLSNAVERCGGGIYDA